MRNSLETKYVIYEATNNMGIKKEQIIGDIIDYYHKNNNVCIRELLDTIGILNISLETAVEIYTTIMSKIEGDTFIHIFNEGVTEDIIKESLKEEANFKIY